MSELAEYTVTAVSSTTFIIHNIHLSNKLIALFPEILSPSDILFAGNIKFLNIR